MRRATAALMLAIAALAVAQHWEFEQVDSAGWGAGVQMRWRPDGRLVLCYSNVATGAVRLAFRDTAWHLEPTGFNAVLDLGYFDMWQSFDITSAGTIGVTCVESSGAQEFLYAERTDTGWVHSDVPYAVFGGPRLAFDSGGSPCVSAGFWNRVGSGFIWRSDSIWAVETLPRGGQYPVEFNWAEQICFDKANHAHALYMYYGDFTATRSPRDHNVTELWLYEREGDSWRDTMVAQTWDAGLTAPSLALDSRDSAGYCFSSNGFNYMGEQLTPASARWSALAFDSLDRPNIAYATEGQLVFCYRTGADWRSFVVAEGSSMDLRGDLCLQGSDPVIAFSRSDGLWLAHGVDVTGTEEGPMQRIPSHNLAVTVLRRLPTGAVVFDAMGRRALDPKSGVYFLRDEGRGAGDVAPARTRKVVLQH